MNAATVLVGLLVVLALVAVAVTVVAAATARRVRGNPDTLGSAGLTFPPPGHDGSSGTRTVTTDDGASLAVAGFGPPRGPAAGPTFVLAHGWAADRTVWAPVARRLVEAGCRVVVYDQRGHGASTAGTSPFTIDRLGRDLTAVVEALDLVDVVVGAHSGGGYGALAAVVDVAGAGSRVSGLVLVATAAQDVTTSGAEVRLMGSRLVSWVTARPRLGLLFLGQTLGPRPGFAALDATRALFAATPAGVRGAAFASSRGLDLRAEIGAVAVPAVVVHGDADRIIAPERGSAVADALADARLELVPGVGHMVPLEAPRRLAEVLVEVAAAPGGVAVSGVATALAAVGLMATAVEYGTDVFAASVLRPALREVDDAALTDVMGNVHRYGDSRLAGPSIVGLLATGGLAVVTVLDGRWGAATAAGLATAALVLWLVVYFRVSVPVNRQLIQAAGDGAVPPDVRALQSRWDAVITARTLLQAAALAGLIAALALL